MKKMLVLIGLLLALAVILTSCGGQAGLNAAPAAAAAPTAVATVAPTAVPELTGDSIRGGKLYNGWVAETAADAPTELNPVWKASNAGDVSMSSSWSCSKCHGYDYAGAKPFRES